MAEVEGTQTSGGNTTGTNVSSKDIHYLSVSSNDSSSVSLNNSKLSFSKLDFFHFVKNIDEAIVEVSSAIKSCDTHNNNVKEHFEKQFAKRLENEYCIYTTDAGTGLDSKSINTNLNDVQRDLEILREDCYDILKEINWYEEYSSKSWVINSTDPKDTGTNISNEGNDNGINLHGGYTGSNTSWYPGATTIPSYINPVTVNTPTNDNKTDDLQKKLEDQRKKLEEERKKLEEERKKLEEDKKKQEEVTTIDGAEEKPIEDINAAFPRLASEKVGDIIDKIRAMDEDFTIGLVNVNSQTGDSQAIWVDLTNQESVDAVLKSISDSKITWGSAISVLALGGKSGKVLFGNLTSNAEDYTMRYKQSIYTPPSNDPPEDEKKQEEQQNDQKEEPKDDKKEDTTKAPSTNIYEIPPTTSNVQPTGTATPVSYVAPVTGGASAATVQEPTYTPPVKTPTYNFESMDPIVTSPDFEASKDPYRIISEEPIVRLDETPLVVDESGTNTGAVNSEIKSMNSDITPLEDIEKYKSNTNAAMGAAIFGGAALGAGNIGYNVYKAKKEKDDKEDKEG